VILLLSAEVSGWAQTDFHNGVVEFYTTPSSARPESIVIYSGDQRLGEVSVNQSLQFSSSNGTYSFGLTPNASAREQLSISLREGQYIYIRVTSEGFYLGNSAEAVRPLPVPSSSAKPRPTGVPANVSRQNSTIFFYRDRQGPTQQVTIYSLFIAGSRPIATLQKGEYFALSISPGMNAFSWTPAPARRQTIKLDILPGEQIFLKVQPSGISPIADATARLDFQDLQTIPRTSVFDRERVVDEPVRVPIQAVADSADRGSRPNPQQSRDSQSVTDIRAAVQSVRQQSFNPENPPNKKPSADEQSKQTVPQAASGQKLRQAAAETLEVQVHGYVTAVYSPMSFEMGGRYRVTWDKKVKIQFKNRSGSDQFHIESMKVGTELDIQGDLDEKTRELHAKTIEVDFQQFRLNPDVSPSQPSQRSEHAQAGPQDSSTPQKPDKKPSADAQSLQTVRQPQS